MNTALDILFTGLGVIVLVLLGVFALCTFIPSFPDKNKRSR